jgi:hypothetical protein
MSLKLNEKNEIPLALDNMMDDDVGIVVELSLLLTLKKEVCVVLDSFCSFLRKYEGRNANNMFSLILTLVFKTFV